MSLNSSENGTDGDDERDEEEEDEDSVIEDEEEEDEPRLKYQRMGGSVPALLSGDAASCIAVAERMIALGTRAGAVHILDFLGNQVVTMKIFSCIRVYLSWIALYVHIYECNYWIYSKYCADCVLFIVITVYVASIFYDSIWLMDVFR